MAVVAVVLHLAQAAGLEVILDVVYNHTAEGGTDGPTLSFRGLGEMQYYRNDGHGGMWTPGCGNRPEFGEPRVCSWCWIPCATG